MGWHHKGPEKKVQNMHVFSTFQNTLITMVYLPLRVIFHGLRIFFSEFGVRFIAIGAGSKGAWLGPGGR